MLLNSALSHITTLMTYKTAIIGASGYTGAELLRLLAEHPNFEVVLATGDSTAGKFVTELYPHLLRYNKLRMVRFEEARAELARMDLVFCGLPHGEAMKCLPNLESRLIIDLGSDFRLVHASDYQQWYGREHTAVEELGRWVYGLPELFRDRLRQATRIANPGCYATVSILPVAPIIKAGLCSGPVMIDAASGTSGAGKVPKAPLHFSHVYEDLRAYKVTEHQHTPEIEQSLSRFVGHNVVLSLTPRLVPMSRGIHAVCCLEMTASYQAGQALEALSAAYVGEYFVKVCSEQPGTNDVSGSNFVHIAVRVDFS